MIDLNGTCGAATAFERDLEIPADIAMLRDAREWAGEAADAFGMPDDACFQVKLAMSEAVTNAIIHGSSSAADAVEIGAHEEDDLLVFEVRDRANKRNGGLSLHGVGEGGRGLELVGLMMDEVRLSRSEQGSVLRFAKRR